MKASDIFVLIGCEESQTIALAFRELGVNAFSCDLKPCSGGHPEWHIQGDVFEAVNTRHWDLAIFHPECTYLTVTANKWLKDQPARKSGALVGHARRAARNEAVDFFINLTKVHIDRWAIENPVGCMSTVLRKPDQIIQPMMFGHPEPKKTCLWLKNMPKLKATDSVEPEYHITATGKRLPKWYAYADKSQGQAKRAEIRSVTFPGIAKAMGHPIHGLHFKPQRTHIILTHNHHEKTH